MERALHDSEHVSEADIAGGGGTGDQINWVQRVHLGMYLNSVEFICTIMWKKKLLIIKYFYAGENNDNLYDVSLSDKMGVS